MSHADILGKSIPSRGKKGPKVGWCLACLRKGKEDIDVE